MTTDSSPSPREIVFIAMAAAGAEYLSIHASEISEEMSVDFGPVSFSGREFLKSLVELHSTTSSYFRVKKRFQFGLSPKAQQICRGMEDLLGDLAVNVIQPIALEVTKRPLRNALTSVAQSNLEGEGKGMGDAFANELKALREISRKSQDIFQNCSNAYTELDKIF